MTAGTIDLTALSDDGDTIDLPSGARLRLRIEPDYDYNGFDDADCYGRIAPVHASRNYTHSEPRPEGFTGNAEKVWTQSNQYWWEPPTGMSPEYSRGGAKFSEYRQSIIDLLAFGWHVVTVELLDGTDHYGRGIVRDSASLGAVDDVTGDYLAEIVADLASEILA